MGRKKMNSAVGNRAWNIIRLALLWARKGGVFKRRLMTELRVLPKHLKNLTHNSSSNNNNRSDRIGYGERELTFDKTPVFHVKMHRPASMRYLIPCINPRDQVDFDYDFDEDDYENDNDNEGWYDGGRISFLRVAGEKEEEDDDDDNEVYGYGGYGGDRVCEDVVRTEEEGIDSRAEEFITKFYEQIKMQRQISYLQ